MISASDRDGLRLISAGAVDAGADPLPVVRDSCSTGGFRCQETGHPARLKAGHSATEERTEEITLVQIAQALYVLSTAAFTLIAAVVALRLIRLSSGKGWGAERWLGLGILGTAVLGYGIVMTGTIGGQAARQSGNSVDLFVWISIVGFVFHNFGVMAYLRFIRLVFRPDAVWARVLSITMGTVLWVGWIAYVVQGDLHEGRQTGPYWIAFAVIGTYPLWMTIESFSYYVRMRRRLALGLAEPLVTDRFRLWGLASLSAAASIWCVHLPALMGLVPGTPASNEAVAVATLITGLFGIGTVLCYWLTFFPPDWYRQRIVGARASVRPSEAG